MRRLTLVCLPILVVLAAAASALGIGPFGSAFRLSTTLDGSTANRGTSFVEQATSPDTGRTLLAYVTDAEHDGFPEVRGNLLAEDGKTFDLTATGDDFPLSDLTDGTDASESNSAVGSSLDVAHAPGRSEWLVAYAFDDAADADDDNELQFTIMKNRSPVVLGRELESGAGFEIDAGPGYPSAVFNPVSGEWLVVWADNRDDVDHWDVYAQRVSTAGDPIGDEVQVSEREEGLGAIWPDVTVDAAGQYLVVFEGTQDAGSADEGSEIFLQRLSPTLAPVGPAADTALTATPDGGIAFEARQPAIARDPRTGRSLVAYRSIGAGAEYRVHGRVLGEDGAPLTPERDYGDASTFEWNAVDPGDFPTGDRPRLAAGNGRFLVGFDVLDTQSENGPQVVPAAQEVSWEGARLDGNVRIPLGGKRSLRGAVSLIPGAWLYAYTLLEANSHTDVHGRLTAAGAPLGPDTSGPGGGTATPSPTPTPTATPAPLPAFSDVVKLPSNKKCVRKRRLRFRVTPPTDPVLAKVRLKAPKAKRTYTSFSGRLTFKAPKRGFTLRGRAIFDDGRLVRGKRRYRACRK